MPSNPPRSPDDPVLRWGAWLGSEPYATLRIASLRRFIETHAYAAAEEWFLRERSDEPPALPAPGTTVVVNKDCAGWWRRATAYGIDLVVVSAIITSFGGNPGVGQSRDDQHETTLPGPLGIVPHRLHRRLSSPLPSTTRSRGREKREGSSQAVQLRKKPDPAPSSSDDVEDIGPVHIDENGVTVNGKTYNEATTNEAADEDSGSSDNAAVAESKDRWENFPPVWIFHRFTNLGAYFWTPVYLAVLVAIAGQSFGMMICGLRVVTVDFRTARHLADHRPLRDRRPLSCARHSAEPDLAPRTAARQTYRNARRQSRAHPRTRRRHPNALTRQNVTRNLAVSS